MGDRKGAHGGVDLGIIEHLARGRGEGLEDSRVHDRLGVRVHVGDKRTRVGGVGVVEDETSVLVVVGVCRKLIEGILVRSYIRSHKKGTASPDLAELKGPQGELGDDAKVASASLQCLEQIRELLCRSRDDASACKDDLVLDDIVTGKADLG